MSLLLLFQDVCKNVFCQGSFVLFDSRNGAKVEIFFWKQFEISKSFWVERFSQCALWSRGMEESFLREFPVLRENGGIVCLSKSFFRIWGNLENLIKSYQIFIFIWIPSTDREPYPKWKWKSQWYFWTADENYTWVEFLLMVGGDDDGDDVMLGK